MSKPVNKLKEPVTPVEEKVREPKKPEKNNKVIRSVASVVSGSFLSKETTLKNLPFIFFLSFLAICYIANGYYADDQVRRVNRLNNEIKELRTQYIVVKDSLVIKSKQTEIAKVLAKQQTGIKESVVPPKKIVIKKITTELKED
ncbi:MAG TPA: FtsL-like putative cell division protein [Bacteroidia bacterium]|nr:FtsL-like putative cell division protein [Bacteroidia bacterium]HRG53659.1 FtsL-like putative cell division protein [Bacteroidia bacterium]